MGNSKQNETMIESERGPPPLLPLPDLRAMEGGEMEGRDGGWDATQDLRI